MTIGEIIAKKRTEKGMCQADLAKKLGVSRVLVLRWENDIHAPNIFSCWDLADVFGCTIDELCGRKECSNDEKEN